MNYKNAIEVKNVKKAFKIYYDKGHTIKERVVRHGRGRYENREVLKGISFDVQKGEAIALIGHNGCGKSTTLKLLTKIIYPDEGSIQMEGRVSSLIELGAGFHPDMTGRENIYINASIFGLSKREIDRRLDDIIDFSELGEYIDNPVRTYSSGMYMRLAFSVAINVDADILLIDEILAVGDANFQAKCFNKLREIKGNGVTIVIVTHDLGTVESICTRAIWINDGAIVKDGQSGEVVDAYLEYMNEKKVEYIQKQDKKKQEKKKQDEKKEKVENCQEIQEQEDSSDIKQDEIAKSIKPEKERVDTTSNHFGLKYIEIEKVEFFNEEGIDTLVHQTGEASEIRIHYKNHNLGQKFIFGVGFYSLDGKNLYGNNTQIDRIAIDGLKEKGIASYRIKSLPLLAGEYNLNVAIVDEDGTPMDFYRRYCTFSVVSKDRSTGYFTVDHEWEIK